MRKIFISFSLIIAISASSIFAAFADTQETTQLNTAANTEYSPEYSVSEYFDPDPDLLSDTENEDTASYVENDTSISESDVDVETPSESYDEPSSETYVPVSDTDRDNSETSDSVVENETESIQEDSLNDTVKISRVSVKATDPYVESYYTKYGNDFFQKRMYDKYDETNKTYNLTYTVYLSDGSTFIGNKDDLYAEFGEYPIYSDKAGDYSGSSELIVYEKFMDTAYLIRFRLIDHAHTIVVDPAVAATETSTGLTEGSHCSVCGDVIIAQEIIPTLAKHTGWYNANGIWFYYDSNGNMVTGWLYRGQENGINIWYYFNESGAMITGWKYINGWWYYFNSSGRMAVGWTKINGTWYYMGPGGAMYSGWQKINGSWYYMNSSGGMVTGWQYINSKWYFFNSSGIMAVGWLYRGTNNSNEIWYYFDGSGVMQSLAWLTYKNNKYYFDESGRMVTEATEIDGKKYNFNSDGTLVTETGWTTIDGYKYYINSGGTFATGLRKIDEKVYYFDSVGRMYTGWKVINGTQYYFKSAGEMAIGWLHIDGDRDGIEEWYYFDSDGSMHVGFLELNGSEYYFDTTSNDTYRGILKIGTFTVSGIKYVTDSEGAIISKSDQDSSLSDDQIAIIEAALSTPTTAIGYCAAWVDIVLQNAGFSSYFSYLRPTKYAYAHESGLITSEEYAYDTAFNANDYWAYVCYSSNENDLEPGMIVATRSTYTTLGKQFGHVGIYLGDGKVISSVGYIEILSLSEWNARYNNTSYGSTIKWGFIPAMR